MLHSILYSLPYRSLFFRFSEQETSVESFILEVKVSEPMASIALVQNSLEVPEFYGISSKPLDKNILSFKPSSERPRTSCVVRTLVSDLNLPGYGQVVIEEPKRDSRLVSGSSGNLRVRSCEYNTSNDRIYARQVNQEGQRW